MNETEFLWRISYSKSFLGFREEEIDNSFFLSFRASGRVEIKIWTDSQMVAFLIQIIFMAAATGETELRKTRTK